MKMNHVERILIQDIEECESNIKTLRLAYDRAQDTNQVNEQVVLGKSIARAIDMLLRKQNSLAWYRGQR